MKKLILLPVLILLSTFARAEEEKLVSGIDMFSMIQIEQTKPIFDYCKENVPDKKVEIESSFSHFSKISREAILLLMEEEHFNSDELKKPSIPESQALQTREMISKLGENMLVQIKDKNPEVFCSNIVKMMQGHTVESYKLKLQPQLKQYLHRIELSKTENPMGIQHKD
ncbi:hypothetical protein ACJJIE_11600 [Microbulbifer sp. TRSA001]|uniref:hypothetical protein n=1 Tax=Microbulbifer sp. TRSA001 TaxID=3243381 RepID=UPI004039F022